MRPPNSAGPTSSATSSSTSWSSTPAPKAAEATGRPVCASCEVYRQKAKPGWKAAGATGNATARMFTSLWSHWLYSAPMGIAIALLFTPGQQPAAQTMTYRSTSVKACSQILDSLTIRLRRHPRTGTVACYATSYLAHGLWNLWGAMTPLAFGALITLGCITTALLVNGLVDRH